MRSSFHRLDRIGPALDLFLWLIAATGLSLAGGRGLATLSLVLAASVLWSPRGSATRWLLAALQGTGCCLLLSVGPFWAQLLAVGFVLCWLALYRPRDLILWLVAACTLAVPALLAQSGGKGAAPELETVVAMVAGLGLVAVVFSFRERWTPGRGVVIVSALMITLAITGRSALALRGVVPEILGAPRYSARAFELSRLGLERLAAYELRGEICGAVASEDRATARRLMQWGALLTPNFLNSAEGRLWRAELIARHDMRQAREIFLRTVAAFPTAVVATAPQHREPLFVLHLLEWAEQGDHRDLADQMASAAVSDPLLTTYTSCEGVQ